MVDPLPILPFTKPVAASVRLPGSKSITNRALILAALGDGETLLEGALFSEDTEIMVTALQSLGFSVETDRAAETIRIRGENGKIPNRSAQIHVGNAGTAARFLTAFCCLADEGDFQLDGVPQMRKRPMKGLIDALAGLGARIESDNGFFPIRIRGGGLSGGEIRVDATESSQMLSALLMVAPAAKSDCVFVAPNVRAPFVLMTLQMMEQFGQSIFSANPATFDRDASGKPVFRANFEKIRVPSGQKYRAPGNGVYPVEADMSAASYFLALPFVTGGKLTLENLPSAAESLQGDAAFIAVLEKIGIRVSPSPTGGIVSEFVGPKPDFPLDLDFNTFSDTFLTLAAITPLLPKPVTIRGIRHTRKQETDRVSAMTAELRKLGQNVVEEEDSLAISPVPLAAKNAAVHQIETYRDHRFAMSFGILGSLDLLGNGQPWLAIRDPGCCAKTFPEFFRALESVRQRSH